MLKKQKAQNGKVWHLILVRHGESVWNAKGLWTGWQDVSLTEKGKEEARLAARTLVDIKIDIAAISDLKRAHETWEVIKETLNLYNIPTLRHHAYKERHYGIFTGKSKREIKKQVGEEKFKKIRRGWDEPIPQGETLKDVYNRTIPHLRRHILPHVYQGKNVIIVAHGNTHRAIIKHLENISDREITEIEMVTGEVLVYKLDSQGKILKKERKGVSQATK